MTYEISMLNTGEAYIYERSTNWRQDNFPYPRLFKAEFNLEARSTLAVDSMTKCLSFATGRRLWGVWTAPVGRCLGK